MNIHYRIVKVHDNDRGVVVRYFTDTLTEMDLAISFDNDGNVAMENGYPIRCRSDFNISFYDLNTTQEDILNKIKNAIPVEWLKLQEDIKNPNINTDISPVAPPEGSTNTIVVNI